MSLRQLRETPVPEGAEERAWEVARAAYEARDPAPARRRSPLRPALALAAAVAAAGVLASPPGWSLIHSIRVAVGVKEAQTELFSLPAPGRLLVVSQRGLWVVQRDGSRRLLGGYRDAAWSPHGLYLAATRPDEVVALDPKGQVRWTLPRPGARFPSWTGSFTDTRIAYVAAGRLHVVAGDGTGDHALGPAATVAPAWRPGGGRVLAYATPRGLAVYDADRAAVLWSARGRPVRLEWSSDGARLLARGPVGLQVFDARGRVVAEDDPSDATHDADAAFVPGTHRVAVIRVHGAQSDLFDLATGRTLFRGTGAFGQVVAAPDGRWLLVTWPTADQWVFVRAAGAPRIRAVAGIIRQLGPGVRVAGWCC